MPWGLKNLFDEWVEREERIKLLLHTQLCGCRVEGKKIRSILFLNKAGTSKLTGKVFIDASGDGDLDYQAGAEMEDSPVQFPCMNFYMANVNVQEALNVGEINLMELQSLLRKRGAIIWLAAEARMGAVTLGNDLGMLCSYRQEKKIKINFLQKQVDSKSVCFLVHLSRKRFG